MLYYTILQCFTVIEICAVSRLPSSSPSAGVIDTNWHWGVSRARIWAFVCATVRLLWKFCGVSRRFAETSTFLVTWPNRYCRDLRRRRIRAKTAQNNCQNPGSRNSLLCTIGLSLALNTSFQLISV